MRVSVRQFKEALSHLLDVDVPVLVLGPPGVGKSECIAQVAAEKGLGCVDVRLTTMEPVDLRGLPRVSKSGETSWARPSFFPTKGEGVITFDEIAQAPPSMQAAAMQAVLERRIGEHLFPPGWRVVAAGNRQEDRAGASRVITPLLNRFVHLEVEANASDWLAWAEGAGLDHRVRSYIKWRPDQLFQFDPASGERAFRTPRSWAMAARALQGVPQSLRRTVVSGAVGEAAGAEFDAFLALYEGLPDPDLVWSSPETAPVPGEVSALWALGGVLCEGIRGDRATREKLEAFSTYVTRIPNEEMAVAVLYDGFNANYLLRSTRAASKYLAKNIDLVVGGRGK